jgi:hypothetical protein
MEQQTPRPFAHLDAPLSETFRRVMRVFVANKRRFVVHLRAKDVADALRREGDPGLSQETVDGALDSLAGWGNLRADPDTSRVTTRAGPVVLQNSSRWVDLGIRKIVYAAL